MRLIDADELRKATINNFDNLQAYFPKDFIEEIDNAPTVEPETKLVANVTFDKEQMEELVEKAKADILAQIERPQGKWARHDEWVGGEYVGGFYHVNCPEIEKETALYSRWTTNFCPNCGAEMVGGES